MLENKVVIEEKDELRLFGNLQTQPFEEKVELFPPVLGHNYLLSQTEITTLFNQIDTKTGLGKRDYALLYLLLYGELKPGEIINLRLENVLTKKNQIQLGLPCLSDNKTKDIRLEPPLSDALQDYLDFINFKQLSFQTPLFVRFRKGDHPTGFGLTRRTLEIIVSERGRAVGLSLTPQGLRAASVISTNSKPLLSPDRRGDSEFIEKTKAEAPGVAHEKIRKLSTLVNVARDLTSYRSTLEVISQVLHSAVAAIETADAGIFYLYDTATGFLKVQHTINFTEAIYRLRIRPGEIMSGKAFASGYGSIFNSADEWLEGFANVTPSNKAIFMEATSGKIPQSALIAPLKLQGQPIGVIALDNFSHENAFNQDDLDVLQLLANQAAIAVDNVRLYENQSRLVQRLEQALKIHDHLTATVLQGHGIEGIVARLDSLLGNPVVLFDRYGEVRSNSRPGAISPQLKEGFLSWLGGQPLPAGLNITVLPTSTEAVRGERRNPAGELATNLFWDNWNRQTNPNSLLSAQSETFAPKDPAALVAPINVGGELLGWVMIIPAYKALGEFDSVALEHAATVFGLEFMKQQALFEVEVRWKGDLIDDLLAGKAPVDLENRARALGIALDEPFICMYFDLDRFAQYIKTRQFSEPEVQKIKERMYQTLNSLVKSFVPAAFISLKSAEFIIFLNVPAFDRKIALEIAHQIAESFQAWLRRFYPGLSVSIAISGIASEVEAMSRLLLETQRVLKLYRQAGRYGGIFFTEELGVDRLLLQFPDNRELLNFAERLLGPVLEHDRANHNDLLGTLAAYCANHRNFGETARALHMHQNTVRYRMERVNELLSEVISKPEGWFNLELALRILRLQGGLPEISTGPELL